VRVVAADPLDPTGAFADLSRALLSGKDMDGILNDVVLICRRSVPGAEEASITLIRGNRPATVAATGQIAIDLDEAQYEQGYGPCLDAGRTDEVKHIDDMTTETRWPRYTPQAVKCGARSSLSIPLPVENYLVGALNIYSTKPHAFTEESVRVGSALGVHLTAALSHAESSHGHRLRAEHLEKAMESRSIIEQAKGIIMAQQKCNGETAFAMLRKLSMDQNVRLQDLCASLVSSASGHPVRLPSRERR
jgi:GAF domain-containing protein